MRNSSFLDTIHETKGTLLTALIKIDGQKILFKLDTGAEAIAISTKTFKTLKNIRLQKSSADQNNQPLNVLAQAVVQLTYEERSWKQPIYIIEGLKTIYWNYVSAFTALQLFTKVDCIQPGDVQKSFLRPGHSQRRLSDPVETGY